MLVATGLASAAVERRKAGAPPPGGGEERARRRTRWCGAWLDGAYRRSASLLVGGKNLWT